MSELLQVEQADGVFTLTLNRAARRNALNGELIEALLEAIAAADHDANARVMVLRANGPDFCAGADLGELLASADRDLAANEQDALRLGGVFQAIRRLPLPVIASVQGRALAGGMGLITACDMVIAASDAQLGYPEIQRGMVPAMVMTMLRRLVGERVAFDLVATGRIVAAAEALSLGLITRVCEPTSLAGDTNALAALLATRSRSAIALTKRLLYDLDHKPFDAGIALGARVNALARATPEFRSSIAQFLEPAKSKA